MLQIRIFPRLIVTASSRTLIFLIIHCYHSSTTLPNMTRSFIIDYKVKRKAKVRRLSDPTPARRATFDIASLSSTPSVKIVRSSRRHSMPIKKSVQFSSMATVFLIKPPPHSDDVAPTSNWYNSQEHQQFKKERISDVLSIRRSAVTRPAAAASINTTISSPSTFSSSSSATSSSSEDCPVGLEQLLSKGSSKEALFRRKFVIQTVLVEQHRQRTIGHYDPDKIATLSYSITVDSFLGAQKRGRFQAMAKFV